MARTFKDRHDIDQDPRFTGMSPAIRAARVKNVLDFYEGREPLDKEMAVEDAIALALKSGN